MDTPPEEEFDRIVRMASRAFQAKTALVAFVHRDRQFFKARFGMELFETERELSFCAHTIKENHVLVVPDATKDERFKNNSLVTGDPFIRFYAGAPLVTPSGYKLGTLCIIDPEPRENFSIRDCGLLQDLADLVMERLELRRLQALEKSSRSQFEMISASTSDAIVCTDSQGVITSWNDAATTVFQWNATEVLGQPFDVVLHPSLHEPFHDALRRNSSIHHGSTPWVGRPLEVVGIDREGREIPIEMSIAQWQVNGRFEYGASIRNVSERKRIEAELRYAAEHDALTGLYNRAYLQSRLREAEQRDDAVTLLLLDLDGFKEVNDTFGHSTGDGVLRIVAERLRQAGGRKCFLSRLGGDEFVVLVFGECGLRQAEMLAPDMIASISRPIRYEGRTIQIGASAGLSWRRCGGCGGGELLGNADFALYQAKEEGRGTVRKFEEHLRSAAMAKAKLGSDLTTAWKRNEFELYFQPQVALCDGRITGAEALIRWNRPDCGVVPPREFLPILQHSVLVETVGEWVLRTACAYASEWRRDLRPDFRIAVNLFAAQFYNGHLEELVGDVLLTTGLPPTALELELTETVLLTEEKTASAPLSRLRQRGVSIAFDDFGTGYATFSMLKSMPVTRLKIDRSFISAGLMAREDLAAVEAIMVLARGFGLKVTAEGIETAEQAAIVKSHGCAEGQGYIFGRPMPADAFERMLRAQ
ncbi:EAL domain-containing protein [Palleronia sp.]|uniref:sensor domain-containing phosphodiesterase n=1 Tax=Palleronia sp. TaxID=1940284 RepID=UPI0035C85611